MKYAGRERERDKDTQTERQYSDGQKGTEDRARTGIKREKGMRYAGREI